MKITDKVVTSKGRFGTITNISIDGTKAHVLMGKKEHEILITELNLLSDTIPINVEYLDKYDSKQIPKTEILHIPKNTIIYENSNKEIELFINTKLLLNKRLNNPDLIILKIKLL